MRSIPLAMTWEMLARGRWAFLGGLLGANVLPILLFSALQHERFSEIEDQSYALTLHVAMMPLSMVTFAAVVIGAQPTLTRLNAHPIPTSTLVAWRLLPGMVLVALGSIASCAFLNATFSLHWPLWGPALFIAAAIAAFQATLWLTEGAERNGGDAIWVALALGLLALVLGLWFKARYGPIFDFPRHYWSSVTPGEALTLVAIMIVSYWGGIKGVARSRCGEPPYSFGVPLWLVRLNRFELPFDMSTDGTSVFRIPQQAQSWFEWRLKGWAIPAVSVFVPSVWVAVWSIACVLANADLRTLFQGFLVIGGALSIAGVLGGLTMGNLGASDKDHQIGSFLATRPMTTVAIAYTVLRVAGESLLLGWSIWATSFFSLWPICWMFGANPPEDVFRLLPWWFIPATLLGAWTAMGVMLSAALMGRAQLVMMLIVGIVALPILASFFIAIMLSHPAQILFAQGAMMAAGIFLVLLTILAFVLARRRSLIGSTTVWIAAIVWGVLCVVDVLESSGPRPGGIAVGFFAAGLLALSVAPLATAPLALAWNRTR